MSKLQYFKLRTIFDRVNRTRFGGSGRLAGDAPDEVVEGDGRAKIMNVPGRVNISILEPISHVVVARTLSRDDGTWEVPGLNSSLPFTVIGTDHRGEVNSAIQDWVYPAEME